MALWKITDLGPKVIPETKLKEEKLLEKALEDWIAHDPTLLGEPLLIIGRQVVIPDVKDRLDLLALDPQLSGTNEAGLNRNPQSDTARGLGVQSPRSAGSSGAEF